jgi:hypothetical protein
MVSNFSTHDYFFASGKKKQIIVKCITRWKHDGEEMFLNKQKALVTKGKVVRSPSKDAQEKVYLLFNFNYFPLV